jgi:ion channel
MSEEVARSQDADRQARALRRFLRAFYSADSYGLVLLMIVTTYALSVASSEQKLVTVVLVVQIATVWLALRTSLAGRRVRLAASALFVFAAVMAIVNLFTHGSDQRDALVFSAASVLYLVAPVAIVKHLAFRQAVDQETMLGALAAYLLIGMAFAFAYRFVGAAQAGPFFGSKGDGSVSSDLFFSFVTLTTTGYGNLVPAKNPGQTMAVLEALLGQLFLVTAVAKVVNAWRPRGWQPSNPAVDPTSDAP